MHPPSDSASASQEGAGGRRGVRWMRSRPGMAHPSCLRLRGLNDRLVAFPSLMLENQRLDGDLTGVGVQFGESLIFGRPTAVHEVCLDHLAGLVKELDDDVLPEIGQGHL